MVARAFFGIRIHVGNDLRKGVAFAAVEIGQSADFIADFLPLKDFSRLDLHLVP